MLDEGTSLGDGSKAVPRADLEVACKSVGWDSG